MFMHLVEPLILHLLSIYFNFYFAKRDVISIINVAIDGERGVCFEK